MTAERVALDPVDEVDVTIVVDNFIDVLMATTERVRRAPLAWDWAERDTLVAEHGYSLLVQVRRADRAASVLFDAGLRRHAALHNLDVLGVGIKDLRAVGRASCGGSLGPGCRSSCIPTPGANGRSCFPPARRSICRPRAAATWSARAWT
jgi:hypothetical protein